MKKNRLAKLRSKLDEANLDAMVIWRQQNLYYFSGFTGSTGMLVITAGEQLLLTDFRYLDQAAEQAADFRLVPLSENILETMLAQIRKNGVKQIGFEENYWTYADYQKFLNIIAGNGIRLVPAGKMINELRAIKSREELAVMQQAINLNEQAFQHLVNFARPGITELEVAAELEYFLRKNGSSKPAFESIVVSGPRGSLPHGVASGKKIGRGELVTVDFGSVYAGYCSDITRNFIFGEPDGKQREIYDLVYQALQKALAGIKAGITGKEADNLAREVIAGESYGVNFGHGLGHGVGLNIHEEPVLGPNSDTILQPGMVVTVEPGIYITGWGGVRIEDMVFIQESGCQLLTNSPKNLHVIT